MSTFIFNQIRKAARYAYYSRKPRICMDIATWAVAHKIKTIELFPPVNSELEKYVNDDEVAYREFCFHRDSLIAPQVMISVKSAIVRDSLGLVQLPDGQVCYQGNWYLPYLQKHPSYQRRFCRTRHISGDVYSLLCHWGAEYYHWFHDVLPRLEYALPHLPAETKFLIHERPKSYQLDSLQAFGISQNKLIYQPAIIESKIERLWFATPIGHSTLGSGIAVTAVAQRLKRHFGISDQASKIEKNDRIYISRERAVCRRVINEAELIPLLLEHGFTLLQCETFSLAEQIRLFNQASIVLAPHGAGLMNLMFSPANTSICEITAGQTVPCYLVLAKQLGLSFVRLQAQSIVSKSEQDFYVEPQALLSWLHGLPVRKKEHI